MYSKALLLALVPSVFGAVQTVQVGANNQLTFTPNTLQAQPGDQVKFVFMTQNHTVTSGNPNAGCTPSNVFNSGFVPVANANAATKPSFTVNIANTNPINVYCAQAQHCQSGMVMVINPTNTGATSLAAYQQLSAKAKTNTPANNVGGGTLANTQQAATKGGATGAATGATGANGAKAGANGAAAGANGAKAGAAGATGNGKTNKGKKTRRSAKFAAEFVA